MVATAETIAHMEAQLAVRGLLWDVAFPGQIPESPVTAVTVPGNKFLLEGYDVNLVPVGSSDAADSSVVHVPSIGLVVAGDVLYNGAHMYLGDGAIGGVQGWREAIARVAALKPRHVVAGHGDRTLDHDAERIIAGSLAYLDRAESVLAGNPAALAFFEAMLKSYPDFRYGTTLAWVSAKTIAAVRDGKDHPTASLEAWTTP